MSSSSCFSCIRKASFCVSSVTSITCSFKSITSIKKGLGKLVLNEAAIERDLNNNWMVVAEAIQTILRREGYDKPYEMLKDLTRTNEQITQGTIHTFIDGLNTSDKVKNELKAISPFNYTGI